MAEFLSHEVTWLGQKLAYGRAENMEASDAMREAVENGNVWHDNAEYDEVIERMKRIDSTYGPLANQLAAAEVVGYPEAQEEAVVLGSLVRLKDAYDTFDALIVGNASLGSNVYEAIWQEQGKDEELVLVGVEAPMAKAMLGQKVGAIATWRVETRELSADIIGVDNGWLGEVAERLVTAPVAESDTVPVNDGV